MRNLTMERGKKGRNRSLVDRSRPSNSRNEMRPASSSHVVAKRSHGKDMGHERHQRIEKERPRSSSDQDSRRHVRSDHHSIKKYQGRDHRNSTIQLVNRGRRKSDGSSTSDTSDSDHKQQRRHDPRHNKRPHEESFEELSRRKKLIESELHALEAEEKAAKSEGRRSNRNRTDHRSERPVRIKQESMSDDDNTSRPKRPKHTTETRHRRNGETKAEPTEHLEWGRREDSRAAKPEKEKEKPNFQTSGKLAEDTNTYNGVVIKYNEPSEARKPRRKWRLYPFKGDTSLPFVPIHRQSAYLLGRSRLIADIPIDHPSCSKQHAVLQFRLCPYKRPDGTTGRTVRPYIIDLDSSNGTYVNNKRIDARRYVELIEKDVLKFGFSTRVYVILHEDSKNPGDDDVSS